MRPTIAFSLVAVGLLSACGGAKEAFLGVRAHETCDQTWPVCDRVVGCILGEQTYVTGRFPAKNSVIVRLAEASAVKVGIFVEGIGGTGTEDTYIHWWENGCTKRIRSAEPAAAFVAEVDRVGVFERTADLVGVGDHLIEFSSDSQAQYFVRIDVTLKRDEAH